MRTQIAAANWKMNLTYRQGEELLDEILDANIGLKDHQRVVFAVPFPYLIMANSELSDEKNYYTAAQNCSDKRSGAYTGEVSVEMLGSINVPYVVIGHSERREYFAESNQSLAQKATLLLEAGITPIFCCGEPLSIREAGTQNEYVRRQLEESLFGFAAGRISGLVIAYEPIWAIGTGKTASTEQAQEMHAFIRATLADKYGQEVAQAIPILYGGSVKANNAKELFGCPDVDGGLVGGASLIAADFIKIIDALK